MIKISFKNVFKNTSKIFNLKFLRTSINLYQEHNDTDLTFLDDENCKNLFPQLKNEVKFKHTVFAIQPNMKDIPEKLKSTSADLQLLELCALVESIPMWRVIDKAIHPLKWLDKSHVFGKGKLEELTKFIKESKKNISAVVIGLNTLNSKQLSSLQRLWNVPVYDRYTLVLEIFRIRATTNEARLQVSLAEIHYLRSHLYGMHSGSLDFQKEGLKLVGGLGEAYLETRKVLLRDRELRIEKELQKIENQRMVIRENRRKMQIPVIAIVGYTNAGKTSLIKSLTKNDNLNPKNELFATLDISSFLGYLPNRMKVLYVDTIGFISDIHPSLFNAFSATLQDIAGADLLIHVSDASHPNQRQQDEVVRQTLTRLPLMHQNLLNNVLRVYNKVDLLDEISKEKLMKEITSSSSSSPSLLISVKEGWNRDEVLMAVQEAVVKATGRITKKLKIPINGNMLQWLYKESEVEEVLIDATNPEMYLVKATMTSITYAKFCKNFKLKIKNT